MRADTRSRRRAYLREEHCLGPCSEIRLIAKSARLDKGLLGDYDERSKET